ncbi:MFS transporter [Flavobacterium subsaxonicum]|uniref:Major facilitator transporter n=1 Tax=Flavobacterium subsaxonicum WB 4.1-42 = DSM 21790 TaxID=1121898 RepID=A0A0A2MQ00_9FLAO|nr:MFS transporter [Flavobacterium subsaxonicum]KGO94414.1 major facilitator transporter [Flavobacterium subsaxonicum WB 4.1-42 = DSM 21790]
MSHSPKTFRIAVAAMFFMAGLCFASWASRIATIQQKLSLSDAQLGGVLFALPVGLMLSLPISGWAVTKMGSRKVLAIALTLYALALVSLGYADTTFVLVACLTVYGLASNAVNISVNTQAVATEVMYTKPIMASFHGLWSLAGFLGAGVGTLMIAQGVVPQTHFIIIAVIIIATIVICWNFLHNDRSPVKSEGSGFVMPDKSLISLGLIAFCSMVVEGAMFDWSVIYLKKVVQTEEALIGAGYTAGMCFMAAGRFVADWFSHRFGLKTTLQVSGALSTAGLLVVVIFPTFVPALIGFMLVGAGISSVVPMVYSAAGRSTTMLPGPAIAAVSTISFVGFLVGPPVIGFLAEASSLKISFLFLAVMALFVVILSTRAKI